MVVGLVVGFYWARLDKQSHQRQVLWEWPVGKVQLVQAVLVFGALVWVTGVATMLWH